MLKKILITCLFAVMGIGIASAADPQQQVAPIDEIVIVINEDVITRYELDKRIQVAVAQLKKQNIALPAQATLEKQVSERMITEMLQTQFAKETGIRIDDSQLERALQRIAQANKLSSVEELRARVEQDGMPFEQFREDIRSEIALTRLREREVDSKIVIAESEVDSFVAQQDRQENAKLELHFAHIFVGIPERANAEAIRASQQRANEAQEKLLGGAQFAQIAAGYSDAKDALNGGDLGWRPADRIPPMFLDELKKLKPGGVTPVLRSPNGFHLLKLLEKRSRNDTVVITQSHARHILIKTSELTPEREARAKIEEVKRALDNGSDFAEQAKLNSEDNSASRGGDLGWMSPGDTVPEFDQVLNTAQVGQIVGPIQTQFGFHLIQVLERRNQDVSVEQKRMQARQAIRAQKSDENWQDWLRQQRDRAYIEYRIEQPN